MRIGVVREKSPGERRVALIPETVKKLSAKNLSCIIEAGAGESASFSDEEYRAAGATVAPSAAEVLGQCEALIKVARVTEVDISGLSAGQTLLGHFYPAANPALMRAVAERKLSAIALDQIPRTSIAQAMDVLSSQANLGGYWAVIAAADRLAKIFPMLMTAAGTITPARVLIMGTGVAGLSAIGTARRLGAVVEATDVRPETKEQVESLGARFLVVQGVEYKQGTGGYAAEQSDEYKRKQAEMIATAVAKADVVICTALIPGRPAPRLVTAAQVQSMRPGSVIVDLAAEQGGNVEGSRPGEDVIVNGVTIVGAQSAQSHVAFHASQVFSRNLEKLLLHLSDAGAWKLDVTEEITRGCLVVKDGDIVHAATKDAVAKLGVRV